ncbi:hypothetical protein F4809DRAFT_597313 [Biscogniauxia mediterranea]|nr:hypothetical protein F4809DRAFT_597313 [Biscogniauxia mediterranea]
MESRSYNLRRDFLYCLIYCHMVLFGRQPIGTHLTYIATVTFGRICNVLYAMAYLGSLVSIILILPFRRSTVPYIHICACVVL